jgi:hypothetical protein
MERRHRRQSEIADLNKRLEMKINEHKMLTSTLHEAFRRNDSSASTLNSIKKAIEDTLNDIELLREEIENNCTYTTYRKGSFFDQIKKEGEKHISGCEPKYSYKKPYGIKSFDEVVKDEGGTEHEVKHVSTIDTPNVDNILFSNRFLFDLNVIGIPSTMVKWVCPYRSSEDSLNRSDNFIEVQIYDFVDEDGVPVLAKLSAYDGRKFTVELKHLSPTGSIVYTEKYNGCYLDSGIVRDSLTYANSDPSTITLRIFYDGVSYEASCK